MVDEAQMHMDPGQKSKPTNLDLAKGAAQRAHKLKRLCVRHCGSFFQICPGREHPWHSAAIHSADKCFSNQCSRPLGIRPNKGQLRKAADTARPAGYTLLRCV
eukprot:1157862-Pelagomonas_calceolata.AAC.5